MNYVQWKELKVRLSFDKPLSFDVQNVLELILGDYTNLFVGL